MSIPIARVLRMNDADTMKFVELYKKERVLWDTTMSDYKKRDRRAVAAKRIANAMNINGFTDSHVMIKFKNLRSSYSQELKKIADSAKLGHSGDEVYVPKVIWFNLMDGFLRPHVKARTDFHQLLKLDVTDNDDTGSQNYYPIGQDDITMHEEDKLYLTKQLSDSYLSQTNQEAIQPSTSQDNCTEQPARREKRQYSESSEHSHSQRKNKKSCKSCDSSATESYITSAMKRLDEISENITNNFSASKEDNFDHFGKYVASLLRDLPAKKAFKLQHKVISFILNANINSSTNHAKTETPHSVFLPYSEVNSEDTD